MKNNSESRSTKPTPAFVTASWCALGLGAVSFLIGLWYSNMQLNEKGYYLAVILFGLFASVSLQKSVRDRMEGIKVTEIYYSLCWVSVGAALSLLVIGLWNANLSLETKGFYAMAFALSLYASVAVQKNIRDLAIHQGADYPDHGKTEDQELPSN